MSDTRHALAVLHDTIPAPVIARASDEPPPLSTTTGWQPEYWQTLSDILGLNTLPRPLSPQEAIQLSAVLVCLDVLAQDIAKVELRMWRRVRGGKEEVLPREHWLARMLATEPNDHHTWYECIEMLMLHLGLSQNSFIAKKLTRTGQVEELVPVMPGRIKIDVNEDATDYVYRLSIATQSERVLLRNFGYTLMPEQIIHLRGRMFDGLNGYSTLVAGASTMGLAREIADFERRLYENDAQMRGVFEKKDNAETEGLSDEAFQRLKRQLAEGMTRLRREARPLILEEGLTFKSIAMTSDQAEVSKAWEAAVEDLCRLFRMPPHKAMHLKAVKYENLEAMEKSYVSDTLVPYCQRIEQRLTRALLSPEERLDYFLEFDREAMMLADVQKQTEALKVGLSHGALYLDEYRMARGLNPLPGGTGRVRLIPSTYTVIGEGGEVLIPAGGKAGQAEAPPADDGTNDFDAANVIRLAS